jgi:hypothetical protein
MATGVLFLRTSAAGARGQVSHDTVLPDRFAPYTSACRTPLRSISAPNAARRRRISGAENPGHPDTPQMLD